ncbi:MAG: thiosulfate oxidation carrier protein SoxY [Campylobacterales bacterium]|nr:thiosulfate oxidation carrier protein SoxY [Campylobacterales bacterium]
MERRQFIQTLGAAAVVTTMIPTASFAGATSPNAIAYKEAVKAITGGKEPVTGKIKLKAPEIAENGAVVPVTAELDSPMTSSDYVKAIHILTTKNGNSRSISAYLTPANGKAMLSTRIKLGATQEVSVIAELSDGSFVSAAQSVKVTIGGCG